MLLTEVDGGDYLVETLSPKGEQLLWETAHFFAAGVCQDKKQVTEDVEGKMAERKELQAIEAKLGEVFDDPRWAALARKCLGCGVCAFVCPTCHCFDIVDEADAWGGSRCRNWDACAFTMFTQHGSGHNPRPEQDARYRQRVLHKFKYFPETWERLMCVGCGRCTSQCPVNLDIHQVAAAMGAAPKPLTESSDDPVSGILSEEGDWL
jgi:ferredoxin